MISMLLAFSAKKLFIWAIHLIDDPQFLNATKFLAPLPVTDMSPVTRV